VDSNQPDLRLLEGVADLAISDDDADSDNSLSDREIMFCEALGAGASVADAATVVGISPRSARRWRKKPALAELLKARLAENVGMARAVLAAGASKAAIGLVDMASGAAPAEAARCSACRGVLESAFKLVDFEEFASRLAAIEAQQSAQSAEPGRFHR
jgi:hypothetical protein